MANQGNRELFETEGGGDVFCSPANLAKLVIEEENPKHPEHSEHMARVDLRDPDNVGLLDSLRLHGWPVGIQITVYKDGKGPKARIVVADGRRSLTMCRIENDRRKSQKDERGLIRPRLVLCEDPLLIQALRNSYRRADPPMTLARRYLQNKGSGQTPDAAAVAVGLPLATCKDLAKIAGCPNAALHEAVNTKRVGIKEAAEAVAVGSEAVSRMLAEAKGANGEISPQKARIAVRNIKRAAHGPRAKTLSHAQHVSVASAFGELAKQTFSGTEVAAIVNRLGGDAAAFDKLTSKVRLADLFEGALKPAAPKA